MSSHWTLLDELGKKLTDAIRLVEDIDYIHYGNKQMIVDKVVEAKDLVNELKGAMIEAVR